MSTTALDMTLDDMIKKNKRSRSSRGRGAGGGRSRGGDGGSGTGPGPSRRVMKRSANRTTPYSAPKPGRVSGLETGTKLYISNLEYGVSNEDIKELFSEVGELKRYSINYDRSGRSKGTAEVVFTRREPALAAVKKYNNVQLDGKPMKIEVVAPVVAVADTIYGNPNAANRSGPGRGGAAGRSRGGGNRGRTSGRGRGRARGRSGPLSAAALDADLEKYHTESMEIN